MSTQGPLGPPLVASNGTIYWPWGGSLLKSTTFGASWTQVGSGGQTIRPVELPDGTLVSVLGNQSEDFRGWWIHLDFHWTHVAIYTDKPDIFTNRQAFFITHFNCGSVLSPDAIMRLDYGTSIPPPPPGAPTNLRILQ